jgi:Ca2+-binding RTX toxin-like protein
MRVDPDSSDVLSFTFFDSGTALPPVIIDPNNVVAESGAMEAPLADPNVAPLSLALPVDPNGRPLTFQLIAVQPSAGHQSGTVMLDSAAVGVGTQSLSEDDMQHLTYLAPVTGDAFVEVVTLNFTYTDGVNGGKMVVFVNITPAVDSTYTGTAGADLFDGGAGNDTYTVNHAGDVVLEQANAGIDTVTTALGTYHLGANVENLVHTGSAAFTGIGNDDGNVMTGGLGNDYLIGLGGNDTLIDGNGVNTLQGGTGDDIYAVQSNDDTVFEFANEGTDQVQTFLPFYHLSANVENLTFIGASNHTGIGNELTNVITGSSGNDMLDGGLGADTLIGGAGNDSYVVDDAGDVVIENANEGIDTVTTALAFWNLGANIENLTHAGSNDFIGIGNGLDNVLTGGAGNDYLIGGDGNDTFIDASSLNTFQGGAGDDTYVVQSNLDTVYEVAGEGTDQVMTSLSAYVLAPNVENLTFADALLGHTGIGNDGNNVMIGNAGDDFLNGLAGNDTLTGGAGADLFVFTTSIAGGNNVDTITDFGSGTDRIVLDHAIFAGVSPGLLEDAAFALSTAAETASTRVIYDPGTGSLSYDADGSGGAAAIQFATLGTTVHPATLSAHDFLIA